MPKRYHESKRKGSSGMITDDWGAPALLPRQVMDKEWPAAEHYMNYGEPDLFTGVTRQIGEDAAGMRKVAKPHKY